MRRAFDNDSCGLRFEMALGPGSDISWVVLVFWRDLRPPMIRCAEALVRGWAVFAQSWRWGMSC